MKLTPRQQNDLETIKYFIPQELKSISITDGDVQAFFDYSERGIGRADKFSNSSGFDALAQGKRWREWHMRAWEESVLEGTVPYYTLLHNELTGEVTMPSPVIEYMKKSMFGGMDAEIIEKAL